MRLVQFPSAALTRQYAADVEAYNASLAAAAASSAGSTPHSSPHSSSHSPASTSASILAAAAARAASPATSRQNSITGQQGQQLLIGSVSSHRSSPSPSSSRSGSLHPLLMLPPVALPAPRYFALKMLKKSEIVRLKQVEHIKAEKQILSRISHPFIITLYASFQDSSNIYMCMEYIIGGELFTQLRKVGRFSGDTARFYAQEIVLALQYLHSKGVVYRDLKPENLLIDSEGHIKITDFGFAKVVEDRTWTLCGSQDNNARTAHQEQLLGRWHVANGSVCGLFAFVPSVLPAPEYLAPEIIQSKGHNKGVDWWALGILIFEMLAGYPPFYDENPFGIYQKILQNHIDFPSHMDPVAKDLIRKLLTADRTARFGCLHGGAEDIKGTTHHTRIPAHRGTTIAACWLTLLQLVCLFCLCVCAAHKWFAKTDWNAVFHRQVKPPFVPAFRAANDTSNFGQTRPTLESRWELGAGRCLNACLCAACFCAFRPLC